jgi:hypothetical protein
MRSLAEGLSLTVRDKRLSAVPDPEIENGNLFQALGRQIGRWTRRLSHHHSSSSDQR